MSQRLINLNPDLRRLRDDEYHVEEISGYLVVRDVPYLNAKGEILRGVLTSRLELAGDRTVKPTDHVVLFSGERPCNLDGSEIAHRNGDSSHQIGDLTMQHSFSSKPADGYRDYYEKMTTYIAIISNPARAVDSNVSARTHPVYAREDEDDSPFNYIDTASSRADIVSATKKLELPRVAIVGVGGTGSYVLDLVAKTPVREIHLFDGDALLQHNAFRAPGAPSVAELNSAPTKVEYLKDRYSNLHRGIIAHPYYLTAENANELAGMSFAFVCMDGGEGKRHVIEKLEELDISFVDTGMGIQMVDDSLVGLVRLTTSTQARRDHVRARVGFHADEGNNEYARNIQIADLNALNAAFAVIKWKKLFGFYVDLENERNSTYTIDGNLLHNEDQP